MKKRPFRRLHLSYFVFLSLVGSFSLWISPKPLNSARLSFIDAVYNAVSALTVTGLSSVEMHRFSFMDQVILLLLMVAGSQVFTSLIPLLIRRFYSSKPCVEHLITAPHRIEDLQLVEVMVDDRRKPMMQAREITRFLSMPILSRKFLSARGVEGSSADVEMKSIAAALKQPPASFPTGMSTSHSEKREQGGLEGSRRAEAEALATLSWVVSCYFIASQMVGFLLCLLCIVCSPHASHVLKQNHVNSAFFSLFSTVSSFANAGFILLDENLVPLQRSSLFLICLSILILIGNTMYAPTLRLIIWLLYKASKGERKQVYCFLLKSPRRCYTHLFPRRETLWLVMSVVVLNSLQLVCMLGLDRNSEALQGLGAGYRVVDGLFQSITTRNAGMNVVNISAFSAPTLFLIVGMMYIAVYPVYVSRQYSKERHPDHGSPTQRPKGDIYVQISKLLAQDSLLFVAIFFVCLSESRDIKSDPLNFSIFNMIFEVVSAYGNVGLSIGYNCGLRRSLDPCSDVPYSLSGKWSVAGKVVLVVVMLLGRHRGLPEDIDWAISPPTIYPPYTATEANE